ncbi:ATP-grasp domain-containing protein [Amycolatopsis sp. NPDC051758]|uniref:ATP-grasp domain-containing protein n=1 Tax=Amycolatopsis sp. NPDC051758 TaxID=3363935 RepID=UPI0037A917CD
MMTDRSEGKLDVWIGHRASDAAIVSAASDRVLSVSCFGSAWPDRHHSVEQTWENALSVRERWTSLDQHYASRMFENLAHGGLGTVFAFRSEPTLGRIFRVTGLDACVLPEKAFRMFSRKSFLLRFSDGTGALTPDGCIVDVRATSYSELRRRLGMPFVLKTEDTVSGAGVYLVDSATGWVKVAQIHQRTLLTAWRLVDGVSLNFHFCVSGDDKVRLFEPSVQLLTPVSGLRLFTFGGSSFDVRDRCSTAALAQASAVATEFTGAIAALGYRGVGGIDVVASAERAWVVDLNPRFQGSSAALALDLRYQDVELADFQRAAFGLLDPAACALPAQTHSTAVVGGQLILSFDGRLPGRAKQRVKAGVYDMTSGQPVHARSFDGRFPLESGQILMLDPVPAGFTLAPGAPLARILYPKGSVLGTSSDRVSDLGKLVTALFDIQYS